MTQFNKIAIVGTGLIGGSLALIIKKKRLAAQIIGVSRHKKSLSLAKKIKAIDAGSQSLGIIRQADLVILATPVDAILKLAPKIAKIIRKDCLVTDIGSTKEKIAERLQIIFPNFVGSHPLAGSEKRGIANADANIFNGSLCILTPTKRTPLKALNRIKLLWNSIGAKTIILTPRSHDKALSFVSHLPHIVAFSLMEAVPKKDLKLAASGLRGVTRIALSDSTLWSEIFLSNQKNTLKAISVFEARLSQLKAALRSRDKKTLRGILESAKNKRQALLP